MSAAHTPGPWVHYPEDNLIATADGRGLLEWQARSVNVSLAERDANARLIAAAPELLEALKAVHDSAPECWWNLSIHVQLQVKAAIAKAAGGAQ